jgi:sporulation protein YlmC with PRC-barrel domain
MRFHACLVALVAAMLAVAQDAAAASVSRLLGEPLRNERGETIGGLSDLIVDVRDARVVYLIVDAGERFFTLPMRALGSDMRLDMGLRGEAARFDPAHDARFRRAARLLGQTVTHAHPGDIKRLGVITDIEFDPASGEVRRVVVTDEEGSSGFPAGVLKGGRFPPLTRWQADYVDTEDLDDLGWLRRNPSDERRRFHDPRW